MTVRLCDWCHAPLTGKRANAITCSKRCRQARHRFNAGARAGFSPLLVDGPARLAYADPPYPGKSKIYYGGHPDYAGEVDHADLLRALAGYDGWALSTNAESLQTLLALAQPGTRVAAWFRGARPGANRRYPSQAWEPVLYVPARTQRDVLTRRETWPRPADPAITRLPRMRYASTPEGYAPPDALIHPARPRTTDPGRVIGAKPAAFARWVFDLLGAAPGDSLDDLYPGSGGIARAWNIYTNGTLP